MTHGPTWNVDGTVTFYLWAPSAKHVKLRIANSDHAMLALGNGWYSTTIEAEENSHYQFIVDGQAVPDPASRFQPDGVHGPSQLLHSHFTWHDGEWKGRPWVEAVIYELHVGSFSPSGDFSGVEAKLDYLKETGITAIELMPIAAFDGTRGWGYDGVFPYAPHAPYGAPDDLRRLVDASHARGLMVFLDVVYNHFGPSGNYLNVYAKPFFTEKHHTPWGAAIDFSQRAVRDFFIENALNWLQEFHFDGLRFDAVHAILDDSPMHILEELSARIRDTIDNREVHLILENDKNEAHYLERHRFDAQWNDDIHHVFHVLASGETNGYYSDYAQGTLKRLGRCLTQGFDYQGQSSPHRNGDKRGSPSGHLPPTSFINFLQNHDQIGNRALGDRLTTLAYPQRREMLQAILLLSPAIPLLFMGEEWSSHTPFLYFCDFEGELAEQVREGRRKEFASFPEFADTQTRDRIPDPNAQQTFLNSRLDWMNHLTPEFEPHYKWTQSLLKLRQHSVVPLVKAGIVHAEFSLLGDMGLKVSWSFSDQKQLQLCANFGDDSLGAQPVSGQLLWGPNENTLPPYSCRFTVEALHE